MSINYTKATNFGGRRQNLNRVASNARVCISRLFVLCTLPSLSRSVSPSPFPAALTRSVQTQTNRARRQLQRALAHTWFPSRERFARKAPSFHSRGRSARPVMSISFRIEPNEVSSPTPSLAPVPSNYTDQGVGIAFQPDYDLVSGHCRNRNSWARKPLFWPTPRA